MFHLFSSPCKYSQNEPDEEHQSPLNSGRRTAATGRASSCLQCSWRSPHEPRFVSCTRSYWHFAGFQAESSKDGQTKKVHRTVDNSCPRHSSRLRRWLEADDDEPFFWPDVIGLCFCRRENSNWKLVPNSTGMLPHSDTRHPLYLLLTGWIDTVRVTYSRYGVRTWSRRGGTVGANEGKRFKQSSNAIESRQSSVRWTPGEAGVDGEKETEQEALLWTCSGRRWEIEREWGCCYC